MSIKLLHNLSMYDTGMDQMQTGHSSKTENKSVWVYKGKAVISDIIMLIVFD